MDAASAVSVLVIDWTTTGWRAPMATPPTRVVTVDLRCVKLTTGVRVAGRYGSYVGSRCGGMDYPSLDWSHGEPEDLDQPPRGYTTADVRAQAEPPRKRKRWWPKVVLFVVILPLLLVTAWTFSALKFAYSAGERSGFVQKLSRKGWLCKTWEGEWPWRICRGRCRRFSISR